jgi:hypothetical protein
MAKYFGDIAKGVKGACVVAHHTPFGKTYLTAPAQTRLRSQPSQHTATFSRT